MPYRRCNRVRYGREYGCSFGTQFVGDPRGAHLRRLAATKAVARGHAISGLDCLIYVCRRTDAGKLRQSPVGHGEIAIPHGS